MTDGRGNDDIWGGVSVGYSIVAYLLSGLLLGFGIGFGLDHLFHTPRVFEAIGMIGGVVLGVYTVYLHYGRQQDDRR